MLSVLLSLHKILPFRGQRRFVYQFTLLHYIFDSAVAFASLLGVKIGVRGACAMKWKTFKQLPQLFTIFIPSTLQWRAKTTPFAAFIFQFCSGRNVPSNLKIWWKFLVCAVSQFCLIGEGGLWTCRDERSSTVFKYLERIRE